MSFRNRLTLFFVLIVIVPMVAVAVVLFRLISDNEDGKANARLAAEQNVAINMYKDATARALATLERVASDEQLSAGLQDDDLPEARTRAIALLGCRGRAPDRPRPRPCACDRRGDEEGDRADDPAARGRAALPGVR